MKLDWSVQSTYTVQVLANEPENPMIYGADGDRSTRNKTFTFQCKQSKPFSESSLFDFVLPKSLALVLCTRDAK